MFLKAFVLVSFLTSASGTVVDTFDTYKECTDVLKIELKKKPNEKLSCLRVSHE